VSPTKRPPYSKPTKFQQYNPYEKYLTSLLG
jgi:hypothetical protein